MSVLVHIYDNQNNENSRTIVLPRYCVDFRELRQGISICVQQNVYESDFRHDGSNRPKFKPNEKKVYSIRLSWGVNGQYTQIDTEYSSMKDVLDNHTNINRLLNKSIVKYIIVTLTHVWIQYQNNITYSQLIQGKEFNDQVLLEALVKAERSYAGSVWLDLKGSLLKASRELKSIVIFFLGKLLG